MKLVQKILSHGLLIAFFVAVFFLYLYRETLFPQWFGAEAQRVAQQTEAKQKEQLTLRQQSATPATPAAPARPAAQQAGAAGDDQAAGGAADVPPPASAATPAPTETDDSLPPLADAAESGSTAPPHDAGISQPDGEQTASGDGAGDLPPTVGEATASPDADRDMPAQSRVPEQAATAGAAAAPDTAQQDARAGAQATPPSPQYRPVEPPASGEPAGVDTAQQGAGGETDVTSRIEPPGPASAQVSSEGMQTSAGQTGQVAAADSAPPRYRPLQQPRKYPSAPGAPPPSRTATTVASAPPSAGGQGASDADGGFHAGLAHAREVFWSRDMRGAVQAYSELVETYPTQTDSWGELGNLYLTLGQRSEAVDAYYKAIGLLIDQGESIRARYMLRVLHGLDPGKASELEQRLRQVGR